MKRPLFVFILCTLLVLIMSSACAEEITNSYLKRRIKEYGVKIIPKESEFIMKSAPSDDPELAIFYYEKSKHEDYVEFRLIDKVNINTVDGLVYQDNIIPDGWHLVAKQTINSALIGYVKKGAFISQKDYEKSEKDRVAQELAVQKEEELKEKNRIADELASQKEKALREQEEELNKIKKRIPKHLVEKYGFKNIPFGSSHNLVISILKSEYNENAWDSDNFVFLRNFKLGQEDVNVTFYFDHNNIFYAFQFETGSHTADLMATYVYKDGHYLSSIFKNKYGQPAKCFKPPNILFIRTGYTSYLCKWNNKDIEIYTGFMTYEFKFYAVGYVGSKKITKALLDHQNKKEKTGAMKGAKEF